MFVKYTTEGANCNYLVAIKSQGDKMQHEVITQIKSLDVFRVIL